MTDTFGGAVVDVGDPFVDDGGVIVEVIVELAFINELRVVSVDGLDFDSDFKVGASVNGLVDLPKGSFVNFSDNFKIFAYFFQHLWHQKYYINKLALNLNNPIYLQNWAFKHQLHARNWGEAIWIDSARLCIIVLESAPKHISQNIKS